MDALARGPVLLRAASLVPCSPKAKSWSHHVASKLTHINTYRRDSPWIRTAFGRADKMDGPACMKLDRGAASGPAVDSHAEAIAIPFELEDEGAFQKLVEKDGLISIIGFGSLLSEQSARFTFPDLLNFREAELVDFRRVFAHVAPVFLERGIANLETKEMSSLSVEPCQGESIIVTLFEIAASEVPAFIEREHEFRFLAVQPRLLTGKLSTRLAVVCSRYCDQQYRTVRCKGSAEEYHLRYGRHGIEQIWRDDVLPCRVYLRHCVLAAQRLGSVAYASFLDHTFLADRTTTIRMHLEANPEIMTELPPPALAERYGG